MWAESAGKVLKENEDVELGEHRWVSLSLCREWSGDKLIGTEAEWPGVGSMK